MSDPGPHKPPGQDGDTESKPLSPLHALQLRAFLNATEDVDVDPDTIEDLLEGLSEDVSTEMTELDSDTETSDTEDLSLLVQENCTPAVVGIADLEDGGIDTSDLRALEEEAIEAWTKDEIRKMMHHLKERGMSSFIREYVLVQDIPIVKLLFAFGISLCPELRNKLPKTLLFFLRVAISRELHLREKLPQYNTISDAVSLIINSKRIMVLTGAGISVSCGIPDFRSRNGLYATLKEKGQYDLDDPQQMFDIHYFKENPTGKTALSALGPQIYPSNFIPSPCHRFIKLLEDKNKLLRNYTQNIDTLESIAGITRVLQCHGSFKTATCLQCRIKVPGIEIEREILDQRVPYCKACLEAHKAAAAQKSKPARKKGKRRNEWEDDSDESDDLPVGVMKPDITFFGEKLMDNFDQALLDDRDKVDLLLVIGTSLKVSPVSEILSHLPHSVPQILINKTPIRHINPDIVLLGDADEIVHHLCEQLQWGLSPRPDPKGGLKVARFQTNRKRTSSEMLCRAEPARVLGSHVWLFNGAEGGKWVEDIKERYTNTMNGASVQSKSHRKPAAKKARVS
ncbi:DHS-like NAD/FAD-binding domain-containing protein [Butyriboletus roseoflavus]|nr:DHS-like NAD/FAD-binding domain-containing protein [Butyriboletus roseoflavus]